MTYSLPLLGHVSNSTMGTVSNIVFYDGTHAVLSDGYILYSLNVANPLIPQWGGTIGQSVDASNMLALLGGEVITNHLYLLSFFKYDGSAFSTDGTKTISQEASAVSHFGTEAVCFTLSGGANIINVVKPDRSITNMTNRTGSTASYMVFTHGTLFTARGTNQFWCEMMGAGIFTTITSTNLTSCSGFGVYGDTLLVGGNLGAELYDISNPQQPILTGFFSAPRGITLFEFTDSICVGTNNTQGNTILVIDFFYPNNPVLLSSDGTNVLTAAYKSKYIDGKILITYTSASQGFDILDASAIKNYHQPLVDAQNNATIKNTIRLNSVVNHTRPISLLGKYKS